MIKKQLYAIYDKQAEMHGQIFTAVNHTLAKRIFTQLSDDKNSEIGKYPGDYKLVHLGEYDIKTGHIASNPEGVSL